MHLLMTAQGEKKDGRKGREGGTGFFSVALNELDNMPMREKTASQVTVCCSCGC